MKCKKCGHTNIGFRDSDLEYTEFKCPNCLHHWRVKRNDELQRLLSIEGSIK